MLRKNLTLWTLCLLSLFCFSTNNLRAQPSLNVTSDNAYRVGFGDANGIMPIFNVHWFNSVWNSNASQIQNAESYVNQNKSQYVYIACYGGYKVRRYPYADIVVVMDESRSMTPMQLFSSHLIHKIEDTLVKNGIGADHPSSNFPPIKCMNRYGLVGFGGGPAAQKPGDRLIGRGLSPLEYRKQLPNLRNDLSSWEDGYAGIMRALDDYPWRSNAKKIIILVTDENRDDEISPLNNQTADYNMVLNALNKHEVTLNTIVYCDITSKKVKGFANPGGPPIFQKGMAINYNGTVFITGGLGVPYTTSPGGSIKDASTNWGQQNTPHGAKNTVSHYANLAFATGGMAGDIRIISDYGTNSYASASGDTFANIVSTVIINQGTQHNPYRGVIAAVGGNTQPEWLHSQASKWEVYATGRHGNANGIWSATNPPSISEINQHIANANNVTNIPGTSKGWIDEQGYVHNGSGAISLVYPIPYSNGKLATGESNNSNTGYFKIVSPMHQATRWMWYNPDPGQVQRPFEYGPTQNGQNDGSKEFLIFRLKVRKLVTRRSSDDPRTTPSRTTPSRTTPSRTTPSRTGPSRTSPSRTNPSRTNPSRTNPARINPSRTDRPTIRRPLDGRPLPPERGSGRTSSTKPTEQKRSLQKSDREKPAVKKPAVWGPLK